MGDRTLTHVYRGPAARRRTTAQVGLVEIEEIGLVEEPDFVEHVASHHDAGPGQPVDRRGLLRKRQGHDVTAEQTRDRSDPRLSLEFAPDGGETEGRHVRLAVRSVDVTADEAGLRMRLQIGHELAERARIGKASEFRI